MLSEAFTLLLIVSLVSQTSSLWASLLLIPTSVFLMKEFGPSEFSYLVFYLFVMIFIGGLMVLLVSVTSTVYQEQSLNSMVFSSCFLLLLCLGMMEVGSEDHQQVFVTVFSWMKKTKGSLIGFSAYILLVGLFVISMLLLEFKGLVRSL